MSIERLVSTRTEVSLPDEAEVWDLASDEAGDAFEALSSETARRTLSELYDEPQTASELADSLDTSLQNVDYHVQNLRDAGLIEVATTRYSVTGNEMKVYAPSTNAVLLLSKESTAERIRSRIARLFSTLLLIGIGAILFRSVIVGGLIDVPLVEVAFGPGGEDDAATAQDGGDAAADADGASPEVTEFDATQEPLSMVETINPLEHLPLLLDPGVTFVFGAIFAVLIILALRRTWWRQ